MYCTASDVKTHTMRPNANSHLVKVYNVQFFAAQQAQAVIKHRFTHATHKLEMPSTALLLLRAQG